MSLDLLSKLNPKSQSFLPTGHISKYDRDDVIDAICHAKLPKIVETYAFAIIESISNDNHIQPNTMILENYFNNMVYAKIVQDGFQPRKLTQQALARGIARASVYAHFYARGQCKACNGLGIIFSKGSKTCGECWGKGVAQISDVQKCRIAFPMIKFHRGWWGEAAKKYEHFIEDWLNEYWMLVDQALFEMKKNGFDKA